MTTRDPIRLTDASARVPEELASAIRALRSDHGSESMAEALMQRLAAKLEPSSSQGANGTPLGHSAWFIALSVLGLFGVMFVAPAQPLGSAPNKVEAPIPPVLPSAVRLDSVAARSVMLPEPVPASAAETSVALPPAHPRRAPRSPNHTPPQSKAAAHTLPAPAAELVLLRRSQATLRRDPGAALQLAEQHAGDYPQGVFAQEREILAIEALLKLRKRTEAFSRAEQFLARYGTSPYAFRLHAMIEQRPRGGVPDDLLETGSRDVPSSDDGTARDLHP